MICAHNSGAEVGPSITCSVRMGRQPSTISDFGVFQKWSFVSLAAKAAKWRTRSATLQATNDVRA
jgi:hypothetical protein